MSEQDQTVDVVVIGLGPGGEDLAARLARGGLEVVGVEAELVGGECPYWGCIPSKTLIRAANTLAEARRVAELSGTVEVTPDFSKVVARIRYDMTTDWDDTIAADRLEASGARLVRGRGRIAGPGRVEVDGTTITARRGIVLNTGTTPAVPPVPGLDATPYWTNREILSTTTLPASLLVIGGGPIGLELAQAFARFGTTVTVVQSGPRILAPEEPESSALLTRVLRREGIDVRTDATVERVDHDGTAFTVVVDGETVVAEQVLVATGRRSRLQDLGLETLGIDPGHHLPTDGQMRVADGLWAIGDVVGEGAFTHVSMYQAAIAARDLLGEPGPDADYRALSRVTFTDPEVGSVGMSEQQARDAGLAVAVGVTDLAASSRGFIHGPGNDGLLKVVVDTDRGVLVGATSAGPSGGEVLGFLVAAVRGEIPVETLRHTIYAYPTFHRAIETVLGELG